MGSRTKFTVGNQEGGDIHGEGGVFTFPGADASAAGRFSVTNISGDTSTASAAFSEGSRTSAISRVACQVCRDEALLRAPGVTAAARHCRWSAVMIGGSAPSQVQSRGWVAGEEEGRGLQPRGSCDRY